MYGLHRVDWDNSSIVIYLTDEQQTSSVKQELETAAASVDAGISIEFQTAPTTTMEELDQASQNLFATHANWAQDPSAVYYTIPDVPNATIRVGHGELAARAELPDEGMTASGDAYTIEYTVEPGGTTTEAGSRIDDQGGWTGGNWLGNNAVTAATANNSHCGLGFTWRRWSDGALLGGTAEHCINIRAGECVWTGDSFPTLFHNQRVLGTAVTTDPGSDSAFLAPAHQTSFNATTWVGGPATTVERSVTGAKDIDAVDNVVVLSGARNGPPATETVVIAVRRTSCYGPKTVMQDYVSERGDSGSPWLTTYGDGTVRAHGQHHGRGYYLGVLRSLYTPVSVISGRLQASIALAP